MFNRSVALFVIAICAVGCQKSGSSVTSPTKLSGPPANLTLANYEKIREGMTLAEVEAILGPPGSTVQIDVPQPDNSLIKEIRSASWVWSKSSSPAGGGAAQEVEKRLIVVELKEGKVTTKRQEGLN